MGRKEQEEKEGEKGGRRRRNWREKVDKEVDVFLVCIYVFVFLICNFFFRFFSVVYLWHYGKYFHVFFYDYIGSILVFDFVFVSVCLFYTCFILFSQLCSLVFYLPSFYFVPIFLVSLSLKGDLWLGSVKVQTIVTFDDCNFFLYFVYLF